MAQHNYSPRLLERILTNFLAARSPSVDLKFLHVWLGIIYSQHRQARERAKLCRNTSRQLICRENPARQSHTTKCAHAKQTIQDRNQTGVRLTWVVRFRFEICGGSHSLTIRSNLRGGQVVWGWSHWVGCERGRYTMPRAQHSLRRGFRRVLNKPSDN